MVMPKEELLSLQADSLICNIYPTCFQKIHI